MSVDLSICVLNQEPVIQLIRDMLSPADIFSLRMVARRCKALPTCYEILARPFLKQRVDKALSKKINCLNAFLGGMKKTKTMISGGLMVSVIMGTEWNNTDIDMYTEHKLACLACSDATERDLKESDPLKYSGVLATYLGENIDMWTKDTQFHADGTRFHEPNDIDNMSPTYSCTPVDEPESPDKIGIEG